MDKDSWLIFELPSFANSDAGTEQGSMDALRNASETSWFKANDAGLYCRNLVQTPS